MILDSFTLRSAVIQVSYEGAFRLWDRAGELAVELGKVWPSLSAKEAGPNQQTLLGPGYQISPGFNQSTITLRGGQSLTGQRIDQIHDSFKLLERLLEIKKVTRISARVIYTRQFSSQGEANNWLLATGLVKVPRSKVFDQPVDSAKNSVEAVIRFEDDHSFTVVRMRTEEARFEMELDPAFFEEPLRKTLNQAVIDFDRGTLGAIELQKLSVRDWLKGFLHVLRRDLDKVLGTGHE